MASGAGRVQAWGEPIVDDGWIDGGRDLRGALIQARASSPGAAYLLRLCCVSLVDNGCTPEQVGGGLGVSSRTLARWVAAYRRGGVDALGQGLRNGRPGRLAPADVARLAVELGRSPQALGLDGMRWTGVTLQGWLETSYGVRLSLRQCQRMLARQWPDPARGDVGPNGDQ